MLYVVVVVTVVVVVVVVIVVVVTVVVVLVVIVVVVVVTVVVVAVLVVVVVVVVEVDVDVLVSADCCCTCTCLLIRISGVLKLDSVTFSVAKTLSKSLSLCWKIGFRRLLPFKDLFFLFTGQIPFDLSVPHSETWVPGLDFILLEPSAK